MAPILQTIASLDSRSGGTSTCTYDLVKALNASGMPTDILTLQPGSPQERMVGEDSFIHACPFAPGTASTTPTACGWTSTTPHARTRAK